ncbi:MAG: V-type ATP synthase subunit B [Candidatus Hydrogenedentes bacterium]|nr:V-type ATP synthase subunit B [Candidatus Hydrogenedentota bacterium]MBI3118890.1 V-type ATP synthase subunit B [Candidatus Hydrogenedentota bacterium]
MLHKEYWDLTYISGPLIFLKNGERFPTGAILNVHMPSGEVRQGQVLEATKSHAVIQMLQGTVGLDVEGTSVSLKDTAARVACTEDMIGRRFNGTGVPIDGLPPVVPEKEVEIAGSAINPVSRDAPNDFIETGVSAIDGFNTLVRGQKLPIFLGSGLPGNELANMIVQNSGTKGDDTPFVVVFGAMGITARETQYFLRAFEEGGKGSRVVAFINQADDPAIERLFTPRCALTVAEYLAFEKDYQVLVILTDMTNYCEALRQISSAREEIPGRRGYPGYMYTDLSTIYERAGRIRGKKGSITQIPMLAMPDDDITHPIPDLTGYITEGQIVLSRGLNRQGIFPPVDLLPCLSRLMNNGIGKGKTRDDHREWANQLYAAYAQGQNIKKLMAIVGEDALTDLDRKYLHFSNHFEHEMLDQGFARRSIDDTMDLGWKLLGLLPREELTRVNRNTLDRYYVPFGDDGKKTSFGL